MVQGTKNLVDAAKMAGVGSFVLVSSLLTNAKAVGQGSNPNYVVLQLFGGVLEEKLQARTLRPCSTPIVYKLSLHASDACELGLPACRCGGCLRIVIHGQHAMSAALYMRDDQRQDWVIAFATAAAVSTHM